MYLLVAAPAPAPATALPAAHLLDGPPRRQSPPERQPGETTTLTSISIRFTTVLRTTIPGVDFVVHK